MCHCEQLVIQICYMHKGWRIVFIFFCPVLMKLKCSTFCNQGDNLSRSICTVETVNYIAQMAARLKLKS